METEDPERPRALKKRSKTARCRLTIPQILEQIAIGFSVVRPLFSVRRWQMAGAPFLAKAAIR